MNKNILYSLVIAVAVITIIFGLTNQRGIVDNITTGSEKRLVKSQFSPNEDEGLAKEDKTGVASANIVSFEADRIGIETVLHWEATNELELVGYQVEKSCGNEDFERIRWVYAREISHELIYEFSDSSLLLDMACFYRLKMVDFDGKETFSPVISAPVADD